MLLPPKVVHIIYALGTGGLENGLINIINRSPRDRYRHVIICLTDATDFANRITVPDIEVIQLHKKPGHDVRLYWRLWKVLRALRPDIVHTRNLAALEMQIVTIFMPGVKRVHGEHGRGIDDLDGSNRKYNLLRKLLRPLIYRYIAVSKHLDQWLEQIIQVTPTKIKQIYNGVDTKKFEPVAVGMINPDLLPVNFLPLNACVIGTVGRLVEVKNHRSLILAIKKLVCIQPKLATTLRLIIVGGGPLFNQLKQLIEECALSEMVWLTGDREDIPQLLQLMDIFVLPSLIEGISNTVLEAMATGLPVIATDVGGNPELIEDGVNGRLVVVDDHAKLANVIGELITDPESAKAMGESGLKKVQKMFNWDRTVSEYFTVYDEVLGLNSSIVKQKI